VPSWRWSKNHEVTTLHVADARAWLRHTSWRVVPGDTLLVDYIFFVHPTAIGHWWELLGPLFSVLKGAGFARPCDRMVLLHLQRTHLMEWVRAVMAVALGVGPRQPLPPILLQQATDHPWQQLSEWRRQAAALHAAPVCPAAATWCCSWAPVSEWHVPAHTAAAAGILAW
jgi:protein O-GlcNAc transferase